MEQQSNIDYEDAPFSLVHKKITVGVYLGQISDGYTLSIVGTALTYAAGPLGLTSFWIGLIGAGALMGILFGSLCLGPLADRIGRKALFTLSMFAFAFFSGIQFFISDPLLLVLTRFCVGACIGMDYTSSPALLTEWVPRRVRPRLLSSFLILWIIGFVLAYALGIFMQGFGEDGWRWILCSPVIPSTIAFLWRFGAGIPESPVWLAGKGRVQEGLALVHKHLGPQYCLPKAADGSAMQAASVSWFKLFSPEQWRATLISGIFYACQVLPFFGIGIFLPLVLADMNIDNPHAPGILYNAFMFIGVIFGVWLIDKISRRSYLLTTFYISAALLSAISVWQNMPGTLLILVLTVFALVLTVGVVLENSYPPELFPTELRASGVGFATAVSRIGASAGTFLLPVVNEHFGIYVALGGCSVALWLGGIACHFWAPETSDKFKKKTPDNPRAVCAPEASHT